MNRDEWERAYGFTTTLVDPPTYILLLPDFLYMNVKPPLCTIK